MCGLGGWISLAPKAPAEAGQLCQEMLGAIRQRGPDGEGQAFFDDGRAGLVHTRLAIIDPTPQADQPLIDPQTGAAIAFNGEIYNYRALRAELAAGGVRFATTSDTEVLLRGYLAESVEFFRRLRGMYAFAIWDPRRRELVVHRDPLGIKPLYVRRTPKGVLVGSSARSLARLGEPADLDPAGAVAFACLGCIVEPLTAFKGVSMLGPGMVCAWRVEPSGIAERRIQLEPATPFREDVGGLGLRDLDMALRDTVAAHFEADVDVAIFQSAGVDSTLLSSLAREQGFNPVLITLGFEEFRGTRLDETIEAAEIARKLQLPHRSILLGRADFDAVVDRYLREMESPTADAINTYLVSKACREAGFKVALSGVGGDELFAGYETFRLLPRLYALRGLIRAPGARQMAELALGGLSRARGQATKLRYLTRYLSPFPRLYLFRRANYIPEEADKALDADVVQSGMEGFLAAYDQLVSPLGEGGDIAAVRFLEQNVFLRCKLLKDADWAGLAHGVEVRTPLVDATLQRAICDRRYRSPYTKSDVAAVLGGMPGVRVSAARKTGFSIPYQHWFAGEPAVGNELTRRNSRAIQNWSRVVIDAHFPGWGAKPSPAPQSGARLSG